MKVSNESSASTLSSCLSIAYSFALNKEFFAGLLDRLEGLVGKNDPDVIEFRRDLDKSASSEINPWWSLEKG